MYDALTTRYSFACPAQGETRVRLSAFRILDRLPGAEHPAVFHVVFDCPCGEEHPGLVSDAELDWAPLGLSEERFLNLMTARFEETAAERSKTSTMQPRSRRRTAAVRPPIEPPTIATRSEPGPAMRLC